MIRKPFLAGPLILITVVLALGSVAAAELQFDTIATAGGPLKIRLIGHGSVMFDYGGKIVYVDPWSKMADYSKMPGADLILITHHHPDHLDPGALDMVITEKSTVVMTKKCAEQLAGRIKSPIIMADAEVRTVAGLKVEAVPAYNLIHMRSAGQPYHPKGDGNGYIITFGDKRVYVAGDTENTPEMKALKDIDVAFLPMNLPYTMDSAMAADAAKAIRPKIVYPYHTLFSEDQVPGFVELMKGVEGVEVRVRK